MSVAKEVSRRSVTEAFPLGLEFETRYAQHAPHETPDAARAALRALQLTRLSDVVNRAWQIPFYQRLWHTAGLRPEPIRSLSDLERFPVYAKSDLMDSVDAHPPFGDFHGITLTPEPSSQHFDRPKLIMHTTSGTTGAPQPLYYGEWDREVQNALLARAYAMQGLRDDDVVLSVYGFGMVNGGHYVREAVTRYTNALLLPAGTGLETPSAQVLTLMQRFKVTVLLGFGDYMMRLGQRAQEAGIVPGVDIPLRLISGHIDHALKPSLSELWGGAAVRDWYGVGDTGIIAAESNDGDGLHLFEDAHYVEILDPETNLPVADGETGNLCVTVLFKNDVYPIIRFNTQDRSRILPGTHARYPALRRMQGFLGRSDNMVKLRGINIYPTSLGALLEGLHGVNGEYVCRLRRTHGRDEMYVDIEWGGEAGQHGAATEAVSAHLRAQLGVELHVTLVPFGDTAAFTELEKRQKPKRLIDER